MHSKINYILAVLILGLNLIILSVNLYIIKKGFSPFEGGINFFILLLFPNLFMIPALATFFRNLSGSRGMLIVNIVGGVVTALAGLLAYMIFTIQC